MDIDDNEYDIHKANVKSIGLAIFGIITFIINVVADKFLPNVISEFLSVSWWVALWDIIEFQVLDKEEDKWERLNNQQLYDCTFSFVFDIDENGNTIKEEKKLLKN